MDNPQNHLISILMAEEPAAHERLTNIVRRRAPGFVSQGVASGEQAGLCRVTLVLNCTLYEAEAFRRHVDKMIDVIETSCADQFVGAQLALMKVEASGSSQVGVLEVLHRHGARLLRRGQTELVAQVTDLPERVEAVIEELSVLGRTTTMRTGLVAMVS